MVINLIPTLTFRHNHLSFYYLKHMPMENLWRAQTMVDGLVRHGCLDPRKLYYQSLIPDIKMYRWYKPEKKKEGDREAEEEAN